VQIANVVLANPVISAPMAGVTDKSFRILAKEAGCGLVFSEMVSDKALVYWSQRTQVILDLTGEEHPRAVQIFGSEPEYMAKAAVLVQQAGADVIDINMGCPTPKIVKNMEGAALMRDIPRAAAIVRAVAEAVSVPVTVKMRKGWDKDSVNAPELAVAVVEAGAAAVTVHGRTRDQFYAGQADWGIIREVVRSVPVPVTGNGDVREPADAARMLEQTGCAAVMIGRAAMGNPWIFARTVAFLQRGEVLPLPTASDRVRMAIRHLGMVVEHKGEWTGVREMRKHLAWYLKGLKGAARVREKLNRLETVADLTCLLQQYLSDLARGDHPVSYID